MANLHTTTGKRWIVVFLFLATTAFSNDSRIAMLIEAGDKSFGQENYYEAMPYYEKVLQIDKDHPKANYQLAECYRHLFVYKKAMAYYEKVVRLDKDTYPLAAYYLGLMQRLNGDYQASSQTLDDFIRYASEKKFKDSQLFITYAEKEQQSNQFVLEKSIQLKGNFNLRRLQPPVNSPYNDYAASVYKHDSCLVLSSARFGTRGKTYHQKYGGFYADNFVFTKTGASWKDQTAQQDFSTLNTVFDDGAGTFNQAKDKFFFTGCYQDGRCHLYVSSLVDNQWTKPVALPAPVNLKDYSSKQPALSAQADTLYFSSDRPGGYGQLDLWMSTYSQGQWTAPVNLGPDINTPESEVSPFFYEQEKLLFFSSNGHRGYGGFDIFFAAYPSDQPLSINLGPSFNAYKDELYLSLGDQAGYLTSNRDNPEGSFDIYTFSMKGKEAVILSMQKDQQQALSSYIRVLRFFEEKDQQFFEEIPLEDKIKIAQLIEKQALEEILTDRSVLDEATSFAYEALATEEKNRIDRLVLAKKKFLLKENSEDILQEDYKYYENLPLEEKKKVNRIIEAKVFQNVLIKQKQIDEKLVRFFEELPTATQERIRGVVESNKQFLAKTAEDGATIDDLFFYQSLSAEEKDRLDDATSVPAGLTEQEKDRLNRLVGSRLFASEMTEIIGKTDAFDLGALVESHLENIKIQGKIVRNEQAAPAVKVIMESDTDTVTATTGQDGRFEFSHVNYRKGQKLLFDPEVSSFVQMAQYALEELTVTVSQDNLIEETFDNIYFDTDRYTINDSAKVILDSLVAFHGRYPDVQIKISGFADPTGDTRHNIRLSEQRAAEAYRYLVDRNVKASMIMIKPRGVDQSAAEDNLQRSRRIEFEIKGVSSSYNTTQEIYVIRALPDLEKIAAQYHISLSELMDMNPDMEKTPPPFTPVKVVAQRKK